MKKRQTDIHSKRRGLKPVFVYALSFFCIIVVWKILAYIVNSPLVLPSPEETFYCLVSLCKTKIFWHHILATLFRVFLSFFITLAVGTLLGILCGLSKFFHHFFELPLSIVRATPVVSFILLALFWFPSSFIPVFVSVLMTLPVMVTSVATGFLQTDKKLLAMAKIYNLNKIQKIKYLTFPSVKPFFDDGALSSFGLSWKVVAAGEVLCLPKWGSGELLHIAQVHIETQEVVAVTIAVVALSFMLEKIAYFCV